MNVEEAINKVEQLILASKPDCTLIENSTLEYPHCFVFFYQSKKYVETGDPRAMLVGHGPVLVSRKNGRVFETGSVYPAEQYVEALEACGDPYGEQTDNVKITGWHEGANKVEAIKLVNSKSGVGLAQAKSIVDCVLENKESVFSAGTAKDAEKAVDLLKKLGFKSTQLWSNQC
jgi:ribosomal protein L7/L12